MRFSEEADLIEGEHREALSCSTEPRYVITSDAEARVSTDGDA